MEFTRLVYVPKGQNYAVVRFLCSYVMLPSRRGRAGSRRALPRISRVFLSVKIVDAAVPCGGCCCSCCSWNEAIQDRLPAARMAIRDVGSPGERSVIVYRGFICGGVASAAAPLFAYKLRQLRTKSRFFQPQHLYRNIAERPKL